MYIVLQRYLIYNLKATYNRRRHEKNVFFVFAKILNLQLETQTCTDATYLPNLRDLVNIRTLRCILFCKDT